MTTATPAGRARRPQRRLAGAVPLLLVCLWLALSPKALAAEADSTGGIAAVPADKVILTPGATTKVVQIVNASPAAITVTAVVTAQSAADAGVLRAGPGPVTVAAGTTGRVEVIAQRPVAGVLVLSATAGGTPVWTATLAVTASMDPTPAVTTRAVDNRDGDPSGTVQIPLASGQTCPAGWQPDPVVLANAEAGVTATLSCEAGTSAVVASYPALPVGTFTGMVPLGDDKVAVTVTRADPWYSILLWYALGVGAAMVVAMLTSRDPARLAGLKLTSLEKKIPPWHDPQSPADALVTQLVRKPLHALTQEKNKLSTLSGRLLNGPAAFPRRPLQAAEATERMAKLTKDVDALATEVALIDSLEPALDRLRETHPNLYASAAPKLAPMAVNLLAVQQEPAYPTLAAAIADANALATVLSSVPTLASARAVADRLLRSTVLPHAVVSAAMRDTAELAALEAELRDASAAERLVTAHFPARVSAVGARLHSTLEWSQSLPRPALAGSKRPGQREFIASPTERLPHPGIMPELLPGRGARQYVWNVVTGLFDRFVAGRSDEAALRLSNEYAKWFTVGLAIWPGLVAVYFGKPWGTMLDRITAVVYGATTLAVALAVSTWFAAPADKTEK